MGRQDFSGRRQPVGERASVDADFGSQTPKFIHDRSGSKVHHLLSRRSPWSLVRIEEVHRPGQRASIARQVRGGSCSASGRGPAAPMEAVRRGASPPERGPEDPASGSRARAKHARPVRAARTTHLLARRTGSGGLGEEEPVSRCRPGEPGRSPAPRPQGRGADTAPASPTPSKVAEPKPLQDPSDG